jgi:hypothetical protein
VIVKAGHGVGGEATGAPDKAIPYTGAQIEAKF